MRRGWRIRGGDATLLSPLVSDYHEAMVIDPWNIRGYHAHIYYTADNRSEAAALREAVGKAFDVVLGRWHDEPVGPHPAAMYQIAFSVDLFARLMPYLMLNRGSLRILVHPETGNDYRDHAVYGLWLGEPVKLKLDMLRGER